MAITPWAQPRTAKQALKRETAPTVVISDLLQEIPVSAAEIALIMAAIGPRIAELLAGENDP